MSDILLSILLSAFFALKFQTALSILVWITVAYGNLSRLIWRSSSWCLYSQRSWGLIYYGIVILWYSVRVAKFSHENNRVIPAGRGFDCPRSCSNCTSVPKRVSRLIKFLCYFYESRKRSEKLLFFMLTFFL